MELTIWIFLSRVTLRQCQDGPKSTNEMMICPFNANSWSSPNIRNLSKLLNSVEHHPIKTRLVFVWETLYIVSDYCWKKILDMIWILNLVACSIPCTKNSSLEEILWFWERSSMWPSGSYLKIGQMDSTYTCGMPTWLKCVFISVLNNMGYMLRNQL